MGPQSGRVGGADTLEPYMGSGPNKTDTAQSAHALPGSHETFGLPAQCSPTSPRSVPIQSAPEPMSVSPLQKALAWDYAT